MLNIIKIPCKRIIELFFPKASIHKYFEIKGRCNMLDPVLVEDDYSMKAIRKHIKLDNKVRRIAKRVSQESWEKEKQNEREMLLAEILNFSESSCVFQKEIDFMRKKKKIMLFPYEFADKYNSLDFAVNIEPQTGLQYVLHNRKKLFFPKYEDVKEMYRRLLMEQDIESPHRYFDDADNVKGDIFVDVGAAEGIVALDFIDRFEKIYLLESSSQWEEALLETFKDYGDKVVIIKKYAGAVDSKNMITLDNLLGDIRGKRVYIKMDVEGMELDVLLGAQELLINNKCVIACTTYHNNSIRKHLISFFEKKGYVVDEAPGYMVFYYGWMTLQNGMYERMQSPLLRHGIIRGINGDD